MKISSFFFISFLNPKSAVNSCLASSRLFVAQSVETSVDFTSCQAKKICPQISEKFTDETQSFTDEIENGCDSNSCTVQLENGTKVSPFKHIFFNTQRGAARYRPPWGNGETKPLSHKFCYLLNYTYKVILIYLLSKKNFV